MADDAAKREARRQRILANAEYRLQQITGHVNHNKQNSGETINNVNKSAPPKRAENFPANSFSVEEFLRRRNRDSVDSLIDDFDADIDIDEPLLNTNYVAEDDIFNVPLSHNILHRHSSTGETVSCTNYSTRGGSTTATNDIGFIPDRHDDPLANPQLVDTVSHILDRTNSSEQSSAFGILSNRLVYVILAILMNILITLKLEHLFGMSIFTPFFVITIARVWILRRDDETNSRSMLDALRMLCNIRPCFIEVSYRLMVLVRIFDKILKGFAVYLFTFAIVRAILHPHWNDLDTLRFPEDPQAFFNETAST